MFNRKPTYSIAVTILFLLSKFEYSKAGLVTTLASAVCIHFACPSLVSSVGYCLQKPEDNLVACLSE